MNARHLVRLDFVFIDSPAFSVWAAEIFARLRRSAGAVRICDIYLNLWLIYIEMRNVVLGAQNISKLVVPIFKWQCITQ